MSDLIVTGTGTGVGKTVVSALLALRFELDYWKPVQTGAPTDSEWMKEVLSTQRVHPEAYRLRAPVSPHLASRHDSIQIGIQEILKRRPERNAVIEGAGGVLVPLNEKCLMIDLFSELTAPVVVVARAQLGAINHTLLTIEALRRRDLVLAGVILVGQDDWGCQEAISHYAKTRVLATIPKIKPLTATSLLSFAKQMEFSL